MSAEPKPTPIQQQKNQNDPWTTGRLLSWTKEFLNQGGVQEASLAAEVLLAHSLHCQRIDLYARFEEVPDPENVNGFRDLVRRAAKHEPIAYLVGEKEFFSLAFTVTSDVLIPRPETETLVEVVLDRCKDKNWTKPNIFELGVGSGCISIAVLTQLKEATIVASDISSAAIAVATQNADRHGVTDRFTLIEADGLPLPDHVVPEGGFDLIVSNPPYVPANEMDGLDANVRDFEPQIALSDGRDGLFFYKMLAEHGTKLLTSDGLLMVEVADDQAEAVIEAVESTASFSLDATIKDRVCGMERVVVFSVRS